ncbi:MAG: malonyl-CoA decarboxylase [Acidobacteriia bacterium]|nr:malonyl-CoA decarboxylase [Terriglobia bacterium]
MKLSALIGFRPRPSADAASAVPRPVRHTLSLCRALLSERGEVSGGRLATEALQSYQSLDEPARAVFFDRLAREFSPDPETVGHAGDAYRQDPSPPNLARLLRVTEPPRQELFRRLNMAAGGTRVLVDLRRQLLADLDAHPQWAPIQADLAHLLASWFNRGFLELRRIDWRTPAIVLEKLIQYEAVHEIQGWHDLQRRLESDRRCYAFFHPALGDEPIIFVEVALTRGMSAKVQPLLSPDSPVLDPASANCAMFYSITNCQEGLRGVPFGNFLIKKVAEDLSRELPHIRTFATVSPVPAFREWLNGALRTREKHLPKGIAEWVNRLDEPEWWKQKEFAETAQRELMSLCAYYLLNARQGKEPLDPVVRFHLRNGARLERLNWLGDTSSAGMRRSAGLMVNYVYRLADVERNHEQYMKELKVTASRTIESLARQSTLARPAS